MMKKKVIRGAIIGGVIVFLWCLISWMVLPWHSRIFKRFESESSVASVIRDNAPESGVYILPNTFKYSASNSSEEMSDGLTLMQTGPTIFASVRLQGMGSGRTLRPFVVSLIIQIIGAGIVSWMLMLTKGLSYSQKVLFVTLYGLAVGILGVLPAWNWWCFSCGYVLSIIVDLVIGWFLAGLAIAKICKQK